MKTDEDITRKLNEISACLNSLRSSIREHNQIEKHKGVIQLYVAGLVTASNRSVQEAIAYFVGQGDLSLKMTNKTPDAIAKGVKSVFEDLPDFDIPTGTFNGSI